MKAFELNSVSYKNIMSVGDTPISIKLDAVHKTLITGTNGAGKSTMLEAITFALFGKPFRDIKKGQLVNSSTKKNMLVELEMKYDNHTYSIVRGQKPTVFKVQKDGVLLDESASVRDFQSHFEEMIGMNYASFKQIVVLGTAGYTPFMGLNTPSRRKLVEDLLEVSVLAEMDKLNKSEIRELMSELTLTEGSINNLTAQIKTHTDYAERQKKLSGDNVARLQVMYDEAVAAVNLIKEENLAYNDSIARIDLPPDVSEELYQERVKSNSIEDKKNTITRVLGLYEKGGSCPTCLQALNSNAGILDSLAKNKVSLDADLAEVMARRQELSDQKTALANAQAKVDALSAKIQTNRQLAQQHVDRAKKITVALNEAKKDFINNSAEVAELQEKLNISIQHKSDLVVEKHRRGLVTEMLKDSGIKGSIIQKYIPMFNKQINYYLSVMEADYSFTLNEEFSETIKSRGREDFSYASFSQGEKARIDVALLFTWRDIAEKVSGIKINCLFLDEIFDGPSDSQAIKSISQILNDFKDTNVFIISHRDHNPQDYGQHLHMKKVGRFTVQDI